MICPTVLLRFLIRELQMETRLAQQQLTSELTTLNGNYSERLTQGNLHQETAVEQLQRITSKNRFRLAYLFCPSYPRSEGISISAPLTSTPTESRLFNKDMTFQISDLALICKNLTAHFRNIDNDSSAQKILVKNILSSSVIVIFSNEKTETAAACRTITQLLGTKTPPFFILASSHDPQLEFDGNIIASIKTDTETPIDCFNFWKKIKEIIQHLEAVSTPQIRKKNCIVM